MSEQSDSSLQQATDKINAGQFAEALDLARNALVADPSNDEAKLIEAISLSQLGQTSAASESFAAAIRMVPGNAKARYNAGVHEHNIGNYALARQLLTETIQIEPGHTGASALLNRMPAAEQAAVPSNYPHPQAPYQEPAGMPFITNMGSKWTTLGWILGVAGLVMLGLSILNVLPYINEYMSAMSSGDQARIQAVGQKMSNPVLSIIGICVTILTIIYSVMDLIHRRGNFLWLIGLIPCACCFVGFPMQLIYMALGRRK